MREIIYKLKDYMEILKNLQKVKAMLYGSGTGGGRFWAILVGETLYLSTQ